MKARLAIFLIPLFLSGCFTDKDCVCPAIYSPVCGANGKTYGNPCSAECDDVEYIDGECPVYGVGLVEYSGDSLCGFYLRILGSQYKPLDLPAEYAQHNLAVSLRYRRMNTWFTCEDPVGGFQELDILEISKINK